MSWKELTKLLRWFKIEKTCNLHTPCLNGYCSLVLQRVINASVKEATFSTVQIPLNQHQHGILLV